jgi:hypothetical protein
VSKNCDLWRSKVLGGDIYGGNVSSVSVSVMVLVCVFYWGVVCIV